MNYDLLLKVFGTASGLVLLLITYVQYRKNTGTRKAEFLEKLITGFGAPELKTALMVLDDYQVIWDPVKEQVKPYGQSEGMPLSTILRDHRKDGPIGDPLDIAIRDSFCCFLDFLSKLNYYLENDLITIEEISYFRYYIRKALKNSDVKGYINAYYDDEVDFGRLYQNLENLQRAGN